MNTNRLGKFRIGNDTLRFKWRELKVLFAEVVPVSADYCYDRRAVEYIGYSDMFDEIPDCTAAPSYDFEFTRALDGSVTFKAIRVDNPSQLDDA